MGPQIGPWGCQKGSKIDPFWVNSGQVNPTRYPKTGQKGHIWGCPEWPSGGHFGPLLAYGHFGTLSSEPHLNSAQNGQNGPFSFWVGHSSPKPNYSFRIQFYAVKWTPFGSPLGRTLRICLYFGSYLAPCQPGVLKRGPRSGWPREAGFGRFGDPRFGGRLIYSHLTHSSGQEGPNMTLLASQGPYRPNRPNTGQIQAKSAYLGPYGRIWPQMAPRGHIWP